MEPLRAREYPKERLVVMLGAPEVVLILVIALIVFGPRKLPELGKSLGQAMAQFRRASEDFKRTWEQEVELERVRTDDSPSSGSSYDYSSSAGSYSPDSVSSDYSYPTESAQASEQTGEPALDSSSNPTTSEAPASPQVDSNLGHTTASAASTSEKRHWI